MLDLGYWMLRPPVGESIKGVQIFPDIQYQVSRSNTVTKHRKPFTDYQTSINMIHGVLFDMDGVLLDSEAFITQAGILMFKEKGIEVKESDFKPFTGMGENRFLGGVAEKYGIPFDQEKDKARAYAIYGEISHGHLQPLPGVENSLKNAGKRI